MADNQPFPPQAIETEQALLGSMMLDPGAIDRARATLDPDCFSHVPHRWIYAAIIHLHEHGVVNGLTLGGELKRRDQLDEIGGNCYLAKLETLSTEASSVSTVDFCERIILDRKLRRMAIETASDIIAEALKGKDVKELIDSAGQRLVDIYENQIVERPEPLASIVRDAVEQIENSRNRDITVTGISSGFAELDYWTSGFHDGQLIVLASIPSAGKTTLALDFARNAAMESGIGVGIFGPTSRIVLANRLLAAEGQIDLFYLTSRKLPARKLKTLKKAAERLEKAPIYMDDIPIISIIELRAKALRLLRERGIGMIVVDSLESMSGHLNPPGPDQAIPPISQGLKGLAQELNIPVIALLQLPRPVDNSEIRPVLADLREPKGIAKEADVVMFLHMPVMFASDMNEVCKFENFAEIIIAKQPNHPVASVTLRKNMIIGNFEHVPHEWEIEEE